MMRSDHYEVCHVCETWGTAAEGHTDPSLDTDHEFSAVSKPFDTAAREPFHDPAALFAWTPPVGGRGLMRWGSDGILRQTCGERNDDGSRLCLRPAHHAGEHDWVAGPAIKAA